MKKLLLLLLIFFTTQLDQEILAQCGPGQVEIELIIDPTTSMYSDEMAWGLTPAPVGVTPTSTPLPTGPAPGGEPIGIPLIDIDGDTAIIVYNICLDNAITYTFNAYDSYGDAWNGGTYSITVVEDVDNPGSEVEGCVIAMNVDPDNGIMDGGGIGAYLEESLDLSLTIFQSLCTGSNMGCTDLNADNYDATAIVDDSSCIYTLGTTCASPVLLTDTDFPFCVTGVNTANYGNDYSFGECGASSLLNYLLGDDYVIEYTPSTNIDVDIEVLNITSFFTGISIYNGCPDAGGTCVDYRFNDDNTDDLDLLSLPLIAGNTYYIMISTESPPESTTFDLCIRMTPNNCPFSLYVSGPISAGLYEAQNDVYSDGYVNATDTVTFHANNYIDLLPNFDVPINTQFTADIQPCGTPPLPKPINNNEILPIQEVEEKQKE